MVGVIEVVAWLLVLSRFTRVAAWVVCAWRVAIAVNLVTTGQHFDVAVRDLVMAVGAFRLARVASVVEQTPRERRAVQGPLHSGAPA